MSRLALGRRALAPLRLVRVGVSLPNVGLDHGKEMVLPVAEAADRLGFDSVWAIEHVVVPAGYRSTYPYDASGRLMAQVSCNRSASSCLPMMSLNPVCAT